MFEDSLLEDVSVIKHVPSTHLPPSFSQSFWTSDFSTTFVLLKLEELTELEKELLLVLLEDVPVIKHVPSTHLPPLFSQSFWTSDFSTTFVLLKLEELTELEKELLLVLLEDVPVIKHVPSTHLPPLFSQSFWTSDFSTIFVLIEDCWLSP